MEVYGVIYKTTNIINDKTYVGQTTKKGIKLERYLGSGTYLNYAIEKYGKENFEKEILCECFSREQLNRIERLFIKLLLPDYNIADGGYGGNLGEEINKKISVALKGRHIPDMTKRKMSESQKGRKQTNETRYKIGEASKRRQNTDEAKQKMSKRLKGNKYNLGHNHTDEAKKKMSEAKKVKVICVETQERFDSIKEASEKYNINRSHIGSCCKGKRKSAGKLHWQYRKRK